MTFLRVLCKQIQESSTPLVLLKILKEKHPITELLGSIDQAMSASRINNHSKYRGTTLAEQKASLDKSKGACSQCARGRHSKIWKLSKMQVVMQFFSVPLNRRELDTIFQKVIPSFLVAKNADRCFSARKMDCRVLDRHYDYVDSHCSLKSKLHILCPGGT